MRATCRSGRYTRSGRHNDRDFDVSKAKHIDPDRVEQNWTWHIGKDRRMTFEEMELAFYKRHFGAYLEATNQKHLENRHQDRVKSMEQYKKSRNSCPEEVLLQIGNLKQSADEKTLHNCMREYVVEFNKRYGSNCRILNIALHRDESTPHVHIRRVWYSQKDGHEFVSQRQALKDLGYERPNPEEADGRYNNAKIPFSADERQLFLEICERHGLEIEREPLEGRKRISTDLYKAEQELALKKDELKELKALIKDAEALLEALKKGILELAQAIVKEHEKERQKGRERSR